MKSPRHSARRPTALLLAAFALGGCGENEIAAYRVPKEQAPAAAPADAHPAVANNHDTHTETSPVTAPGGMSNAPAVATASGRNLSWSAPAHWQPKAGSAMRKGSYAIPGDANAELAITAFPGDVGGEVANVNRWRGQLQLPALADKEVPAAVRRVTGNGLTFAVVEFANATAAPQRMLGAMVPFEGATWFFKLTGPDALVAQERTAFLEFLQTVKPAAAATP